MGEPSGGRPRRCRGQRCQVVRDIRRADGERGPSHADRDGPHRSVEPSRATLGCRGGGTTGGRGVAPTGQGDRIGRSGARRGARPGAGESGTRVEPGGGPGAFHNRPSGPTVDGRLEPPRHPAGSRCDGRCAGAPEIAAPPVDGGRCPPGRCVARRRACRRRCRDGTGHLRQRRSAAGLGAGHDHAQDGLGAVAPPSLDGRRRTGRPRWTGRSAHSVSWVPTRRSSSAMSR